jgi:glycosyltransferase involved in cell wall biosynthesis
MHIPAHQPAAMDTLVQQRHRAPAPVPDLEGLRVGMVTFSPFPADPRPRRAVEALLHEGVSVDLICLQDAGLPRRETTGALDISRLPIRHRRGGVVSYVSQYSRFIAASGAILGARSVRHPYDLVYVHNMPDILVLSALLPKARGAKVILDMHDPMPELMTTIFGLDETTLPIRLLRTMEKWSMARADSVMTVNVACRQLFASRSCPPEKIRIVMNSPDDQVFRLRKPQDRVGDAASQRPFVLMYHGSIVERNGLDLAVEALGKIHHKIPRAELRIYGRTTPFLEAVLNRAREAGLQRIVSYKGPRSLEDLVPEIEQGDVGLVPNQRNAFTDINTPTRLFEYLALGKPAIAPQTMGITDYFDSDSLFFFSAGDADDMARAIERVYFHPGEAAAVAERGQQVYLSHRWAQEKEILLDVVRELARRHSPARNGRAL